MALFLALIFSTYSSDFIQRVFEGTSTKANLNEAKEEIYSAATKTTAEQLIVEWIGLEKYQRNRQLINSRVVKQYEKFIPFIKLSPPRVDSGRVEMTVNMRVSLKNLQALLLQNGLMYQDDGVPVVLPMIQVTNRHKLQSSKWWVNRSPNRRFEENLYDNMAQVFFTKGFYLMNPAVFDFHSVVPDDMRFDRPRLKDWQNYGNLFHSQIVLFGSIDIDLLEKNSEQHKILVKLSAVQTANGRVIAGVSRQFVSQTGPLALEKSMVKWSKKIAEDLSVQILEAWQRGTFGAQLLTVTINRKLNFAQLQAFKEQLRVSSKDVKTIKDRFFDPQFVRVEMDVTKAPSEFVSVFKDFEFQGLRTEVESYDSSGIVLNVK